MSTPTRIRLNIDQKIKILEESKKTGFNKKSIMKEYGISHPCLWKILNDKEKILKSYKGKNSKAKINSSKPKCQELEEELFEWFLKHKNSGMMLDGCVLKTQANKLSCPIFKCQ